MTAEIDVTLDRPLPQNPDAERAVLGAILTNPVSLYRIDGIVNADDFFKDAHRIIMRVIAMLAEEQIAIDTLTVKAELERQGLLGAVGGHGYVSSLMDGVPDIANVERYARIVKRESDKRRWIIFGSKLSREGMDPLTEPSELAHMVLSMVAGRSSNDDSHQSHSMVEVLSQAFRDLQHETEEGQSTRLTSGMAELDFANVFRRTLVVVASPSNHGKSCFMMNAGDGLARHGHQVLEMTLESTEREISLRWASRTSGVPHSRVQDWSKLRGDDRLRLMEALREAGQSKISMNYRLRTVEGIYAECRRLKSLFGLDAVLIDYAQVIRTEDYIPNEERRLAYIAQLLLEYAIDLDVNITVLSQLNKEWQKRPMYNAQKELTGYDIHQEDTKGCAGIAEAARVMLTFYRPTLVGVQKNHRGDEIGDHYVDFKIAKNNENVRNWYPAHMNEVTQTFLMGTCEDVGCGSSQPKQKPMFEGEKR